MLYSDWAAATTQMKQFFDGQEKLENAEHEQYMWNAGFKHYKSTIEDYLRDVVDVQHQRSGTVLAAVRVARHLVDVCFGKLQVLLQQQIDSVTDKLALFRKTVASTWNDFYVESCVAQASLNLQNDDAKNRLVAYV
jgi:hypothetical protein